MHDYGYHPVGAYSVNATHSCTSVQYMTFKETVAVLDGICWFVKAHFKSGFRQFGTHPVD